MCVRQASFWTKPVFQKALSFSRYQHLSPGCWIGSVSLPQRRSSLAHGSSPSGSHSHHRHIKLFSSQENHHTKSEPSVAATTAREGPKEAEENGTHRNFRYSRNPKHQVLKVPTHPLARLRHTRTVLGVIKNKNRSLVKLLRLFL